MWRPNSRGEYFSNLVIKTSDWPSRSSCCYLPPHSWSAAPSGQSPPSSVWSARPGRRCGSCRPVWRCHTSPSLWWTSDRSFPQDANFHRRHFLEWREHNLSLFFFYLFRLSPFLDAPWKRGSCARNRTMQQIFQNKVVSILTMVTWQRDALLVARFPLTVLVHSAAFAAGLLVAHVWRVVLGANVKLPYGPLGEKMKCYFIISFMKRKHLADSWDFHQKIEMFFWT